jgi:hypothetical protein
MLAAVAAPFLAFFVWQSGLASVGDDSVSYLVIARWLGGDAELIRPWLKWYTHFPPLFPLVLALTGGSSDLLTAHLVVAAFAALSVALLGRYAAIRLEGHGAGVALALAFLMLPTAWISVKGILSESMFLAISLGALHFHEVRVARDRPGVGTYLFFGVLLAAAILTRVVGIMLAAAYAAHLAVAFLAHRDRRAAAWLPLAPAAVLVGSWMALRPGGHVYGFTLGKVLAAWIDNPVRALETAGVAFSNGWLASFMADATVTGAPRFLIYMLGAIALAGTCRAIARNRLDGWYVVLSAIIVFFWPFGETQTRRLLYPLVPLALMHAVEVLVAVAVFLRLPHPRLAAAAALAVPLLPCIPAIILIGEKSLDRMPLLPGSAYSAADITEYYTTINVARARQLAARHAVVLGGLERLARDTPPDARVMWVRPEYVGVLGKRASAANYFDWDARRLAREVRDAKVDFIVIASVYKSDLEQHAGDAAVALRQIEPYVSHRMVLSNPVTGQDEFILMAVDRVALDAYLAASAR